MADTGLASAARLEPFLLMAKSARGAAAAKLCADACAAPGVFVFGELLDVPSIQDLKNNEQLTSSLRLLELFAYGTYSDYLRKKDSLPPLNPAQITKLKQLTLVSLATERRILPYSDLLSSLDCSTIRNLEDLIIDGIYSNVLRARLDQRAQRVEVEYVLGRDVAPENVQKLLASLQDWADTTNSVITTLDEKLSNLRSDKVTADNSALSLQELTEKRIKEITEKREKGLTGKGSLKNTTNSMKTVINVDDDSMEVDEDLSGRGKGRAKGSTKDENRSIMGRLKRNRF